MKKITILDTSVGTLNMGDEIIVDSVNRELKKLFKERTMYIKLPTHERISRYSHRIINDSNFSFVAGTNLLSSKHNLIRGNQWRINLLDANKFKNVILMGVGWNNYQDNPNFYTNLVYKKALTEDYFHSVRDSYTKEKLKSIGITNVHNTGCPTMWELTKEHCSGIPKKKAESVVFTLTDYNKNPEKDSKMIEILNKNYNKVYFWIQGSEDYEYVNSLSNSVIFVNPTLRSYDDLLESDEDLDYVGTRLHAGIRAMQKKRRSIIIGIDNRALEKQKDFSINVLERDDISNLEVLINNDILTDINLNMDSINAWREQFFTHESLV
ncbi:polysaccharide pyruvyl transferase family protein [Ureibacillus chungkukjangi]|uniref:Polysaccharide pyruvyl transferase WcaK-like protein n=1 Tax=Ureibacillus chungkukjangi TaxID=1202712 RepID=A0A318TEY7_9BACL|nr:polysaccharide pyruvyl transferase family protein [Ureibacillus chungkukjangi]PYF03254.1 polysaccharide pyruvyl transferase WcaK-like protein [Ureibacillus chungkukjangi]